MWTVTAASHCGAVYGLPMFPVILQPLQSGASSPTRLVCVSQHILGVTGVQLVLAGHGLPSEAAIVRHLSPCNLHPLLQHHYHLMSCQW
ncbi:hypothetical protein E2C01_101451 [Portunus trituberculatus]|uniref:Uncharacterized protein n=1 Tax=Portunus trituberculatus TaxID=210409 RepID=A0A5B7KAS0_PORTR|nr:hypothetical protein [Portunus trituberculatus]